MVTTTITTTINNMGMMTLTTVTINATSGPGVTVELEPNVCVANQRHY